MAGFEPLSSWRELPGEEMLERARSFRAEMERRRTVRQFSNRPVPRELIEEAIRRKPFEAIASFR